MNQNPVNACLLGSGFLMSMIKTMVVDDNHPTVSKYHNTLLPEQKKIYDSIVKERTQIYLHGLLLGMLLASGYLYMTGIQNIGSNTCVFTLIIMSTAMFYYLLAPKSNYMIDNLVNREQIDSWKAVGKMMQHKYYSGFILGIIGYLLLGYGLGNLQQIQQLF